MQNAPRMQRDTGTEYARPVFSASDPAQGSAAITPDNAAAQPVGIRAIYVGTAGDVVGRLANDGADVTFKNLAVGYHPLAFVLVKVTGTTASNMVALF